MKKLIVFDLDGTLAESKSSLDAEMATLLGELLAIVKVAVISGGDWPQFEKQLLANLPQDQRLNHLSLLPTCGTKFYRYAQDWKTSTRKTLVRTKKRKSRALSRRRSPQPTSIPTRFGVRLLRIGAVRSLSQG